MESLIEIGSDKILAKMTILKFRGLYWARH